MTNSLQHTKKLPLKRAGDAAIPLVDCSLNRPGGCILGIRQLNSLHYLIGESLFCETKKQFDLLWVLNQVRSYVYSNGRSKVTQTAWAQGEETPPIPPDYIVIIISEIYIAIVLVLKDALHQCVWGAIGV